MGWIGRVSGDALVIGAGGAIGGAVANRLVDHAAIRQLHLISSRTLPDRGAAVQNTLVAYEPGSIADACGLLQSRLQQSQSPLTHVVICNGLLHDEDMMPEKRLESVSLDPLMSSYQANAVVPLLWLRGLLPVLQDASRVVVTFLSARVGSIGDNTKGGWYSYRAAKAALNMLLQTASVELARRAPGVSLLAFQPGTTESALSRPFLRNVPPERVFTPAFVADRLIAIMDDTPAGRPLQFIDWAGKPIPW